MKKLIIILCVIALVLAIVSFMIYRAISINIIKEYLGS
jgi:hypothetical protein